MAKKTKKQLAFEKRIAKLGKERVVLERKQKQLEKQLAREQKVRESKLKILAKTIQIAEDAYDELRERPLPSDAKADRLAEKITKLKAKIRSMIPTSTNPPDVSEQRDTSSTDEE